MTPAEIRAARHNLGLTQADFARLLGYSGKSRIAELEAGTRKPGGAVIRLIVAYAAGYRPPDWTKAEALSPEGPAPLTKLPVRPETVKLVRAALERGARRPGDIARVTGLGLLTVQEALDHMRKTVPRYANYMKK